jgi:ubiquinone/menaquinone biosynthesis C-methylase UbiE
MATPAPNLAAVKQRQQETWASGDFAVIGTPLVIVGEVLCEAIDLKPGSRVLDVACGSGTAALAAARRCCDVTGVDYVPALLERGRERANAERLDMTFVEGDAEALPFDDASFDVVLSTFGVMFAPDQPKAASELLRVCRPGGKIGIANWTPEGFCGGLFRITGRHVPPPPGLTPPTRWGTEDGIRHLLGDGVSEIQFERRHYVFKQRSDEAWLDEFRTYFGPVLRAFEALDPAGQDAYATDLLALVRQFNQIDDGPVSMPSEYLEAVAIRR